MELCGNTVYHKKFGQGTIAGCENNILSVVFPSLDTLEQTKKFVFPDVFLNKHLAIVDSYVEEYVQNYIEEHTCSVCGRKNVATTEIDEKMLCKSCEDKLAKKCTQCDQFHLKEKFTFVQLLEPPYYASMCNDCHSRYVYYCDHCHTNFISRTVVHTYEKKTCCDRCYKKLISTCELCGAEYWRIEGEEISTDDEYIQACPDCIKQKTVVCNECGQYVLKENIVNSKYIPAEKCICRGCVEHCSSCGEPVDDEHSCTHFWKTYCKDCEVTKKTVCPICGDEFIPDENSQYMCPDCIDSAEYMQKIKELDFSSRYSRVMNVYDLEYVDRCKLFTNLYENCRDINSEKKVFNNDEPFHYIVMRILGYKAVVMYLPREITAAVKNSANVTMTELRSRKGRSKVYSAINRWLPKSDNIVSIREGNVHLLHYPVVVRAQTKYDKVYGKEWDGPYGYIEIGNYGDTTNFHIIGVLK